MRPMRPGPGRPRPVYGPLPPRPPADDNPFVRGLVVGGCLSAFRDMGRRGSPRPTKTVVRRALQEGTALAAGTRAAVAVGQRDWTSALTAAAAGAAGVLIIERLLGDAPEAQPECLDGEKE